MRGINWVIGGPQGSGVDSSATIFARALAMGGLWVFGDRQYYSNIKGEHSYYQVRFDVVPVRSPVDRIDLLATFEEETAIRHALRATGGGILYDPNQAKTKLSAVPTLERPVLSALSELLRREGVPETVEGVLEVARRRGARLYPIPYGDLLARLSERLGGVPLSTITRTVNVMAVAASAALLGFDHGYVVKAIEGVFKARAKAVEMNVLAAELARDYVAQKGYPEDFPHKVSPVKADGRRILLQGTQAVGLGKLLAGCRVQTYYPITPATDESEFLEANELFPLNGDGAKAGILVIQTEDEIAAITLASGAGLAGARASTSTSGPGFSLMAEGLGYAGMNEIPVVVTLYQRAGPSTGMPTRHEQGDFRFALHTGHGEFPRIVLASGDIGEALVDTVRAFNYAERYQCPVIHLLDKSLANTMATLPYPDLSSLRIDRGKLLEGEAFSAWLSQHGEYRRFGPAEDGISYRIKLGTPGAVFWNTGDEHDELGHITEDPTHRTRMMDKRMSKLETADREIPLEEKVSVYGEPAGGDMTIVSWGSTKGAILDAMEELEAKGIRASFIQARLLNPLPSDFFANLLSKAKLKVAVEMNYSGQFASYLREKTGVAMDRLVVKYNGRPISSEELAEALEGIYKGTLSSRRVVLTHGA
ncbi:MAG: 2-oxoglutarate ferredoxin oxidoreductase subunit alpha [Nitrososphaerota archaeon]